MLEPFQCHDQCGMIVISVSYHCACLNQGPKMVRTVVHSCKGFTTDDGGSWHFPSSLWVVD